MGIADEHAPSLAARYTQAWNSGDPNNVAGFFAADGAIAINGGEPWQGRKGVAEMAAGFFADVPDLSLTCDGVRACGNHLVYLWTFTGTYARTNRPLVVHGWEEWDLDGSGLIARSRGWFNAADYERQIASGE